MVYFTHRFNLEWLAVPDFQGWLVESMEDNQPYCSLCKIKLYAGKRELLRHCATKRHKKLQAETGINAMMTLGRDILDENQSVEDSLLSDKMVNIFIYLKRVIVLFKVKKLSQHRI